MMRIVCVLALLAGVSALQKPGYGDIMRMTLKSRSMSDVSLEMEEPESHDPNETTQAEIGGAQGAFAGFLIMTAGLAYAVYHFNKTRGAAVDSEDVQERGLHLYNKVAPIVMSVMALVMFCAVVGGIVKINTKVYGQQPKTNYPGYEGKSVAKDRIENPGERAFFAAFGLVIQAVLGAMVCIYLRNAQEVQISTSMIMKMGCRGATAGLLATMFVEFIRLPFHNYMSEENNVVGRVFIVLMWVAFIAILEEVLKLGVVSLGLKRSEDDQEAIGNQFTHFIAESAQALAICGLAAGMGFAFVENIPRFYAMSLERPLVELVSDQMRGQREEWLIPESSLRAGRVWTFIFWGVLNLQPWLTGLAAMQLASLKAPIAPMDWASCLKVVFLIHFLFDLLDRSSSAVVEFVGCCAIPYAMYTFYKQWKSLETEPTGLLVDQQ